MAVEDACGISFVKAYVSVTEAVERDGVEVMSFRAAPANGINQILTRSFRGSEGFTAECWLRVLR